MAAVSLVCGVHLWSISLPLVFWVAVLIPALYAALGREDVPGRLASGRFWTGIKAKELGLIDGLGDMRSFLRKIYGDKVKLKLIEPKRGFLGRKAPGVEMSLGMGLDPASIAANLGEGLLSVAEEKTLWARYGL